MDKSGTETEYVAASGIAVASRPARQSHLCCGCCCDIRRGAIIVGIIAGIISLSLLSLNLAVIKNMEQFSQGYSVDPIVIFAVIIHIVTSICCALGIYGAVKYNARLVLLCAIWYSCLAILVLLMPTHDIGSTILYLFFAYPYFVLQHEIRVGIMTKSNYPNEAHSCCCEV